MLIKNVVSFDFININNTNQSDVSDIDQSEKVVNKTIEDMHISFTQTEGINKLLGKTIGNPEWCFLNDGMRQERNGYR